MLFVVDMAIQNSNFSILVEAVSKAGLVDALKADGPFIKRTNANNMPRAIKPSIT